MEKTDHAVMTQYQDATLVKVLDGKKMSQSSISSFVLSTKKHKTMSHHGSSEVTLDNQPSITAAMQKSQQQDLHACNSTKLTVAICDMIYADGLAFLFVNLEDWQKF